MKIATFLSFIATFLLLLSPAVKAQQEDKFISTVINNLDRYGMGKPSSALFVHYDKTIYTNNEYLWFTAYLLKDTRTEQHHTLFISLVKTDNNKVMLEGKYIMRNGLGFGDMALPDTIPPGNYHLIASTNVLNRTGTPIASFIQPITVKTTAQQSFQASLRLLDTAKNHIGPTRVLLKVEKDNKFSTDKKSGYQINYNLGQLPLKKGFSNAQGEYLITIPQEQLTKNNEILFADIIRDKETQHLSIKLPIKREQGINIGFYPEGGHLVEGKSNHVGWEAKTSYGQSVKLIGVLYKDGKEIDTIQTNSYGMGRFKFVPHRQNRYTFRILGKDSIYSLPKILDDGPLMNIAQAVTNDTLNIQIATSQIQKLRLLVHNYRAAFADVPLQTTPKGINVKLILSNVPKGLSTVTLLDSLNRPIAERLFFAHYNQKDKFDISTDKTTYGTREKVSVKLKLTKPGSTQKLNGLVSIACVQENRIESLKHQDIESYTYLAHELDRLPPDPMAIGLNNKTYLEDILLIKGWRQYTWQEMMSPSASDTSSTFPSTKFGGTVTHNGKPLKKPIAIVLLLDSTINYVNTDSLGRFEIQPEQLITRPGKKIILSIAQGNKYGYEINLENMQDAIVQKLANLHQNNNSAPVYIEQNTNENKLKGMEKNIQLKEVVIKADISNNLYGRQAINKCGDYVCPNNILNCPNHAAQSSNKKPIKGQFYLTPSWIGDKMGYVKTIYGGCSEETETNKQLTIMNGIYYNRVFYVSVPTETNSTEPDFASTIYWNHCMAIDGEVEFSFYTSDITGRYRLIVQGLSNDDLIYGNSSINIVRK